MTATLKVKGLSDLDNFLKTLPAKVESNIKRGMLRSAGNVYKEEAKNNVRNVSGDLARSIRVSSRINKKTGDAEAAVKVGPTKRFPGPYYAHFVEYGTRPHYISVPDNEKLINRRRSRKLGKVVKESLTTINRRHLKIGSNFVGPTVFHPGAKPRPFFRPAFDNKSKAAIKAAGEYVKKRLATKHGINTAGIEIGVDEE